MLFELLLLSVIAVTLYLGPLVLRRSAPQQRTYGWMLIADLVLALIALAARSADATDRAGQFVGAIAIGAAFFLVVVPPLLRDGARRALQRDRMRLAMALIELRELLQPGMGARQERELLEAIWAARTGNVDAAVAVLKATRHRVEDRLARRQLDERIAMTFLYARRWHEAIAHYQQTLAQPGPTSPHLLVEMVRAYGELGELARAAELVEMIENSPVATEPVLLFLLYRARLVFLAYLGRTAAVEAILAASGLLGGLTASSREYWSGIARIYAGDRPGAIHSLRQAARLSGRDKRARQLAEEALQSLEGCDAGPRPVPGPVAELADRLTSLAAQPSGATAIASRAPRLVGVPWRAVPVTSAMVVVNVSIFLLLLALFRSTGDIGALVRAGANVPSAVLAGEWWRLAASMFLHVGIAHLILNTYALWVLGRLLEQMMGAGRFFAVYTIAGLIGSVASVACGGGEPSAGASGAVLGILGGVTAELGLHRKAYPAEWRRALLGNLTFLIVATLAIGFYYRQVDQAAHIGGLVGGVVLASLLSPQGRGAAWAPMRAFAAVAVVASCAALAYGAVGVATTRYADTLAKYDVAVRQVDHVRLEVPAPWVVEPRSDGKSVTDVLVDPGSALELQIAVRNEELARVMEATRLQLEAEVAAAGAQLRDLGSSVIFLPPGWHSRELLVSVRDLAGTQRFRRVLFARDVPELGLVLAGMLSAPEALIPDLTPAINRALRSARIIPVRPGGGDE